MTVRTNRVSGEVISSTDINAIAVDLNTVTTRTDELAGGLGNQWLTKGSATAFDYAWVTSARVVVVNTYADAPAGLPAGTVVISQTGS